MAQADAEARIIADLGLSRCSTRELVDCFLRGGGAPQWSVVCRQRRATARHVCQQLDGGDIESLGS
jgi:hypothetical protein